jgi:hypothetical protein
VQINSCFLCALSIQVLAPTRQGSDENMASPRARANSPACFETIDPWRLQVHEDDLGPE